MRIAITVVFLVSIWATSMAQTTAPSSERVRSPAIEDAGILCRIEFENGRLFLKSIQNSTGDDRKIEMHAPWVAEGKNAKVEQIVLTNRSSGFFSFFVSVVIDSKKLIYKGLLRVNDVGILEQGKTPIRRLCEIDPNYRIYSASDDSRTYLLFVGKFRLDKDFGTAPEGEVITELCGDVIRIPWKYQPPEGTPRIP